MTAQKRKCKICGCDKYTPCIDRYGQTCCWVKKDLCSACVGESKKEKKK